MSLNLPSLSAPVSSGQLPTSATARNGDPEKNSPDSFGEVLARAARPGGETATKPADKTAASSSARRPVSGAKTEAEEAAELVNVLGPGFIPLEGRLTPLALPGGAAAAAQIDSRLETATEPLAPLQASLALLADGTMALAEAGAEAAPPAAPALALAAANPKERGLGSPLNARPVVNSQDTPTAAAPAGEETAVPGIAQDKALSDHTLSAAPDSLTAGTGEESGTGAAAPAPANDAANQASYTSLSSMEALAPATGAGLPSPASGMETDTITALPMMSPAAQGPATIASSSLPHAVITPTLPQEIGSSEWGNALGQQLVQMGRAGNEVAELQLNPPGLGPLKVTLSMNDHQVQAMFVSAHSSVRAAVETALPQLRAALADSGISLGDTSVGAESRPQAEMNQGQGEQQSGQRSYPHADISPLPAIAERPVIEPRRPGRGITVDTYA